MSQKWKYDEIYANPNTGYGKTNHGKDAYSFLPEPGSLIDIGCGDNSFIKHYPNSLCVGVDFASPLTDIKADASGILIQDKSYIWLTAFDVLEHLEEDEIDKVLTEFHRIAHCYCFSIAYRDSGTRASDGSTLHPTVQPEEWWIEKISKYATVTKIKQYLVGVFINK